MIKEIVKIINEQGFRYASNERKGILKGEYVWIANHEELYGRNFSIVKASAFNNPAGVKGYDSYFITKRKKCAGKHSVAHEKRFYLRETRENIEMLAELFIKECGKKSKKTI